MSTLLTVAQAALALGVTPGRVRQLLAERRVLGAEKLGRDWLIPSPVRVRAVPRGRPAKSQCILTRQSPKIRRSMS